ncbi:MAG: deoxynucleoside kinase [Bacteroidales bacterium]|jgi:deoxyadenosine/deoxycytidine kinase|nr:deoxynucleoside kinase [Bacteroidales bacterium]
MTEKTHENTPLPYHYIAIEGCIGAGKTELSKRLATEFNAPLVLEQFAENVFLPLFYKEPVHYAFHVEVTFLIDRYEQMSTFFANLPARNTLVFADYFMEKCLIFARNNLTKDEYIVFEKIFKQFHAPLPKPDLLIYLHKDAEHLLRNIKQRGRVYEQNIQTEYLDNIQNQYFKYLQSYHRCPIIKINSNDLDFVNNPTDYEQVKTLII